MQVVAVQSKTVNRVPRFTIDVQLSHETFPLEPLLHSYFLPSFIPTMAPLYPKKWFIVPHDEYDANKALFLGQLIESIETISHPLNRTTLIAPPASEVTTTIQTSSSIQLFNNGALHAKFNVLSSAAPTSANAGRGFERNDNVKMDIDVVRTEIFSPGDDYARANFNASRKEKEMINYLNKKRFGLRVPVGSKNVFMITARKIGKAATVSHDEASDFDVKAKLGLEVHPAMKVEASLESKWKKGLKIRGFNEGPFVFAVQVRKVLYRADPEKEVTTEQYVRSAVMEKKEEEEDVEREEDIREEIGVTFEALSEEGPRIDKYDYDVVSVKGLHGEDEFVVKTEG